MRAAHCGQRVGSHQDPDAAATGSLPRPASSGKMKVPEGKRILSDQFAENQNISTGAVFPSFAHALFDSYTYFDLAEDGHVMQ
ncbi:hypothetical protein chiPu_0006333 [Chiloscyllium punctatum]|uniref:Uncharacterized protein n=1 Tax=Chiloscyllium punctatum TaxID=137246 RepID=A0A401SBX1_CHIPU|nr:hypothetical protein [Chiloscyllium punctatum]